MRIIGKWHICEDGNTRPVVDITVFDASGIASLEIFLIDTGADCTALSAQLVGKLRLVGKPPSPDISLKGITGSGNYVVVNTVMEFLRAEGGPARIRGDMAAFHGPDCNRSKHPRSRCTGSFRCDH